MMTAMVPWQMATLVPLRFPAFWHALAQASVGVYGKPGPESQARHILRTVAILWYLQGLSVRNSFRA